MGVVLGGRMVTVRLGGCISVGTNVRVPGGMGVTVSVMVGVSVGVEVSVSGGVVLV